MTFTVEMASEWTVGKMVKTRKLKGHYTYIRVIDIRTDRAEAIRKDLWLELFKIAGLNYEEWRAQNGRS